MVDYSKPVQWTDGDRQHVGRVAIVRYSPCVTGHSNIETGGADGYEKCKLIRHAHTGELEYVPVAKLSNYPNEPIEVPKC